MTNIRQCPICLDVGLQRVSYEGIKLHQCPRCRGILVDDNKILRIENKLETKEQDLEFFAAIGEPDSLHSLHCPRCRITMTKLWGKRQRPAGYRCDSVPDFYVDHCKYCELTWFDGGELDKLQLSYQRSVKGQESKKAYVNLDELSPAERAEYLKAIADSARGSGDALFEGFRQGISEVVWRFGRSDPLG